MFPAFTMKWQNALASVSSRSTGKPSSLASQLVSHLTKAPGGASAEPKCLNQKLRGASQNGLQQLKRFSTCFTLTSVALWLIRLALLMRYHLQIKSLSVSVVKFYFSLHGSGVWREVRVISSSRIVIRLTRI